MRGLVSHILLSIDSDLILCPVSFSHFLDLEFFVFKKPKDASSSFGTSSALPFQSCPCEAAAAAAVWVRAVGEGAPRPPPCWRGSKESHSCLNICPSRPGLWGTPLLLRWPPAVLTELGLEPCLARRCPSPSPQRAEASSRRSQVATDPDSSSWEVFEEF